jgi:hypothetical protein
MKSKTVVSKDVVPNGIGSKLWRDSVREFSLRDTILKIFQNWYLMPLLSLLGAAIGWGIHQFQPPLYEAKAVFTVNINYNQPDILDKIDDTHYAEDQMIVSVMAVIQSTDVLNQVAAEAAAYGVTPEDLAIGKRIFIERKTAEVYLIVRHQDPQVAVNLANLWAENALEYLKEGQVHALHTYTLNQKIKNLTACLQESKPDGLCNGLAIEVLENQLQQAEAELLVEVQASRGLIPAILFDLSRLASLPDTPVVFQSQVLVLAGGFIGFLVSLLVAQWAARRTTEVAG